MEVVKLLKGGNKTEFIFCQSYIKTVGKTSLLSIWFFLIPLGVGMGKDI